MAGLFIAGAVVLGFSIFAAVGCRSQPSRSGAAPSASAVAVYGLAPSERVPAECKAYARGVLKCVADPHFPADAKQAQTSALAQMMDRIKLADAPGPDHDAAVASAAQECADALSTLQLSSQQACPGAL